jgi:S-adenosylmethionine:tRNA ribosyltransferase-isomerase
VSVTAGDLAYELPSESVARHFADPRESARMLLAPKQGDLIDAHVVDLPTRVGSGDVIIINSTQSRASLLRTWTPDGPQELLVIEPVGGDRWIVRLPPGHRPERGCYLEVVGADAAVTLLEEDSGDCWVARMECPGRDPEQLLEEVGEVPLPPYAAGPADRCRARTTFGVDLGSAAPPTAGLHLTTAVLDRCREQGATIEQVTLHVSLKTSRYRLVDPRNPALHAETFEIPARTIEACSSAGRTIAIGTTVVRALETYFLTGQPSGKTDIFISRGHRFAAVDQLFTNFQAPRSTMLAMIDAFAGERWREVYATAVRRGYRFLALGDACLLEGRCRRTFTS